MLKIQLRAARALMEWTQDDLARVSGVALLTIKRIEAGSGELHASPDVLARIQRSLDDHGILIQRVDAEGGVGVRLMWPEMSEEDRQIYVKKMRVRSALHAALQEIPEDQRGVEIERALGHSTPAE